MSQMFRDAEPEDAWHPKDPTGVLLDNLSRRCERLGEPSNIINPTPMRLLEDIRRRLGRIRQRQLSPIELFRVDLIVEDIEFLFARLEEERDG